CRGNMQTTLGDEHVLTPGLHEADDDIMRMALKRLFASGREFPRPQKTRAVITRNLVERDAAGQRCGIVVAGVEVRFDAVREHAVNQIGDIGLAAAARRHDVFIAKRDVHAAFTSGRATGLARLELCRWYRAAFASTRCMSRRPRLSSF